MNFIVLCFAFVLTSALPSITSADILLEYVARKAGVTESTIGFAAIKDDRILFKGAGYSGQIDILYRRDPEGLVIVDHGKRTMMTVDEQEIERINQQARYLLPLVQSLGEQIGGLSPDQRKKWQKLLGEGIPLDMIARAAGPVVPTSVASTGEKKVAGMNCRVVQIMRGAKPVVEICFVDAAAIKVSDKDAETMCAFFDFCEGLAGKSMVVTGLFGLALPDLVSCDVKGIPVELVDLSGRNMGAMTLDRIDRSSLSPDFIELPVGYRMVPLTLWP